MFKSEGTSHWEGLIPALTTCIAVLALARQFLPQEWVRLVRRVSHRLTDYFNPFVVFVIPEFSSDSSAVETSYDKAKQYLSARGTDTAHRLVVSRARNTATPTFTLGDNEAYTDRYQGVAFYWTHFTTQRQNTVVSWDSTQNDEKRAFQLSVLFRHRRLVRQYLEHVSVCADAEEKRNRQLLVYTNIGAEQYGPRRAKRLWESQPFTHPATFDTIALDSSVRHTILHKLENFASEAEFFRRTGRPHKFGAFLFGPPGTGKTSVIAAIANYMQYSVYDLDLTGVNSNLDLRALLTQISDRAVVVIEDIDTVELPARLPAPDEQEGQDRAQEGQQKREGRRGRGGADDARSRLTLGGLLNFADGIRSSCGSERIFVFTTNHPERLDPALTRPGRMDLHIQLAYCSFNMFAALCKTYLGLTEHPLLGELAKVLRPESRLTPADVTAVLDAHRHDPDAALKEVLRRCSNKH